MIPIEPIKSSREQIAIRIRVEYDNLLDRAHDMVHRAIAIGGLLVEARDQTPHGEWKAWVEDNCPFGRDQASRYIKAYVNREAIGEIMRTSHDLHGVESALRALRGAAAAPSANGRVIPNADGPFNPLSEWEALETPMIERFHAWPNEARVFFMQRLYILFHRLASATPEWQTPIEEVPLDE